MESLLRDLGAWSLSEPSARLDVARALAAALGADFVPVEALLGAAELAAVRHVATDTTLVAVPGGGYQMGLQPEERAALLELAHPSVRDDMARQLRFAEPPHAVRVAPFLCATAPLLVSQSRSLVGRLDEAALRPEYHEPDAPVPCHVTRSEARAAVAKAGCRLLSEAEWEYVAREGGRASWIGAAPTGVEAEGFADAQAQATAPRVDGGAPANAFGLWGLLFGEWVADAWHEGYAGAPADARPWGSPAELEVSRAGGATAWPWRDGMSHVLCHAAVRHHPVRPRTVWGVRFARDVPAV
jgi:formylglycine-generating enzyme required for sulfatase activity